MARRGRGCGYCFDALTVAAKGAAEFESALGESSFCPYRSLPNDQACPTTHTRDMPAVEFKH